MPSFSSLHEDLVVSFRLNGTFVCGFNSLTWGIKLNCHLYFAFPLTNFLFLTRVGFYVSGSKLKAFSLLILLLLLLLLKIRWSCRQKLPLSFSLIRTQLSRLLLSAGILENYFCIIFWCHSMKNFATIFLLLSRWGWNHASIFFIKIWLFTITFVLLRAIYLLVSCYAIEFLHGENDIMYVNSLLHFQYLRQSTE